jgi:hypothetical protein
LLALNSPARNGPAHGKCAIDAKKQHAGRQALTLAEKLLRDSQPAEVRWMAP